MKICMRAAPTLSEGRPSPVRSLKPWRMFNRICLPWGTTPRGVTRTAAPVVVQLAINSTCVPTPVKSPTPSCCSYSKANKSELMFSGEEMIGWLKKTTRDHWESISEYLLRRGKYWLPPGGINSPCWVLSCW